MTPVYNATPVCISQPQRVCVLKNPSLVHNFNQEVIAMKNLNRIIALTDEKNYLRNLLEASEDTGKDLESIIQDKIDTIYQEIDKLEGRV